MGAMLVLLILVICVVGLVWVLAPRERVVTSVAFGGDLSDGADAWLAAREARFSDIGEGQEKRVVWAGQPEERTPVALVYVHGFSASSEEVRPVPDRVAQSLGANLVYTRLAGHGRSGTALAEANVEDWMRDLAEALAIAARIGETTIVMATSTGASLVTLALHEEMGRGIGGVVFLSPNYRVRARAAAILTWPFVRLWGPLLAGRERRIEALNEGHARFWTLRYPTVALLPMAAAVAAARKAPHGALEVPALFLFADTDQVVDHRATRAVALAWGGAAEVSPVTPGPQDDPLHHVVAGDVLSPGQTEVLARAITDWIAGLPNTQGNRGRSA